MKVLAFVLAALVSACATAGPELVRPGDPILGVWAGVGLGLSDYLPDGSPASESASSSRTTAEFLCVLDANGGGKPWLYPGATGRCLSMRRGYNDAGCVEFDGEFPVYLYRITGQTYVRSSSPYDPSVIERVRVSADYKQLSGSLLIAPGFDGSLEYTNMYKQGAGYSLADDEAFLNDLPIC
jgi:hypothetical protein